MTYAVLCFWWLSWIHFIYNFVVNGCVPVALRSGANLSRLNSQSRRQIVLGRLPLWIKYDTMS